EKWQQDALLISFKLWKVFSLTYCVQIGLKRSVRIQPSEKQLPLNRASQIHSPPMVSLRQGACYGSCMAVYSCAEGFQKIIAMLILNHGLLRRIGGRRAERRREPANMLEIAVRSIFAGGC